MALAELSPPIVLPWPLRSGLEAAARALVEPDDGPRIDFSRPIGEPALVVPDSVSWRVFKNPLSLFIGGVTAVILELAEPRVRTGIWEHTTFRVDPVRRLRRTGLAAMVTIYGARSTAEAMIARVRRMHDRVAGTTPSGEAYRANEPELLNWVQGTAACGFLQTYHAYVRPLSAAARNRYYAEGAAAARLYGATGAPSSEAELEMLFQRTAGRLQRSRIVFEFVSIMRSAPVLPLMLRPAQRLLVRAAVELTPRWARSILGLDGHGLAPWKSSWCGRQARWRTASFWHRARRSSPVSGCTFPPTIFIARSIDHLRHRGGDRLRRAIDLLHDRLHRIAGNRVDLQLHLFGFGEEFAALHRIHERLAQDGDPFCGDAGRREERPSHRLAGEHQLENLPLLLRLGKVHDQRDVQKIDALAQRELHQHVDLLVIDPALVGRDHARP